MKALIRVLSCAHSDIQCKPKNRHFTCAIAALRCIDIGTWHPVDRWGSDKSVQPIGLSLNVRHSGWTSSPLVLAPSALRTVWNARIFFHWEFSRFSGAATHRTQRTTPLPNCSTAIVPLRCVKQVAAWLRSIGPRGWSGGQSACLTTEPDFLCLVTHDTW